MAAVELPATTPETPGGPVSDFPQDSVLLRPEEPGGRGGEAVSHAKPGTWLFLFS